MKKLFLSLALVAALLPAAAWADHLQGTFGAWGNDYISVNDPAHNGQQVRFSHTGKVPFVDETGATVDHTTIKPGHPISVEYTGEGDHRVASRVVVHKQTTTTTTQTHP